MIHVRLSVVIETILKITSQTILYQTPQVRVLGMFYFIMIFFLFWRFEVVIHICDLIIETEPNTPTAIAQWIGVGKA